MDILTALDPDAQYSGSKLQFIIGAWVLSALFAGRSKIAVGDGDVAEDDYSKRSIYALLYSIYREMGTVQHAGGEPYEFTFNTWGYEWPGGWGEAPTTDRDPQRFGRNAYSGLFEFEEVKRYVAAREGKVHLVELGCGTGAGAHHICKDVWKDCTYLAVDMQGAAIQTCDRKFVPELGGRLEAVHGDATKLDLEGGSADFVVICETHVTEVEGLITDEDKALFKKVVGTLKPGGYLVWGNAIPDATWQPCFDYLESLGMAQTEVRDVTPEALVARELDVARADAYVELCMKKFVAFRIPVLGARRRAEAAQALKNFYRNPGTRLYEKLEDGTDSYRVALFQKPASSPGACRARAPGRSGR